MYNRFCEEKNKEHHGGIIMNILIIGGKKKADFLMKSLIDKGNKITVIHDDYEYCKTLSRKYDEEIICGDATKMYILEEAKINSMDMVIAMTPKDSDNLVICQLAKNIYGVNKTFATVADPKNVKVFKQLGVDIVISATYVVSRIIEQMATVNDIYNYIPIEDGKASIMEVIIKEHYSLCGKYIKDIKFSQEAIVGCIIRDGNIIIPNGNTKIFAEDKFLIISSTQMQDNIIKSLVGGKGQSEIM